MIGTLTSNIQSSLKASKCKLLSCDYWFELNSNLILRYVFKFMWVPHHNYPLKFVPCVHLSFLIFVLSELISAKYKESNINEL